MNVRCVAASVAVVGVLALSGCGADIEPEVPLPGGVSTSADGGGGVDAGLVEALPELLGSAGCEGEPREPEEPAVAHARCLMDGLPVDVAVFASVGDRDVWAEKYDAVGSVVTGDEPVLWGAAGLDPAGPESFAEGVK